MYDQQLTLKEWCSLFKIFKGGSFNFNVLRFELALFNFVNFTHNNVICKFMYLRRRFLCYGVVSLLNTG